MNPISDKAAMLHACLLDMAYEIKRICDKHNISYFLIGGTLLGCIRHEGIIPWDDDLDIGMLRDDYERFLSVCESELKESFILCTPYKEKKYGHPYAKLRIKNTCIHENGLPEEIDHGIFLDIFPIDRISDNATQKKHHAKKLNFLRVLLHVKCDYKIPFKNTAKKIIYKAFAALLSKKAILRKIEKHQTKYNGKNTAFYANFNSAYRYGKEVFPSESLQAPLQERPFNIYSFKTPHNPEQILTLMYGDYMTPPPPEMRVFRHADDFDFGEYTPFSIQL